MYYYSRIDKKELYYIKRKQQKDPDYVWTKEATQNFRKLNDDLTAMQTELVNNVISAYKLFSNLEKSGLSFLHGFKVVGKIDFEKAIINKLETLEKTTKAQKKIIQKWNDIAHYTADEIDAWQLIYDSKLNDFMPLSKVRMKQTRLFWGNNFGPNEADIELCSYCNHFFVNNNTLTLEDLEECTIEDFTPDIRIILNYNVSEFHSLQHFHSQRESYGLIIYDMLNERQYELNKTFSWTKKNVQKILDVNKWIWQKTDEMKQYMNDLNSAMKFFSTTDPDFKYFWIEGQIQYFGSQPNDIATIEIQQQLSRCAGFHLWSLDLGDDYPEIIDSVHENPEYNWNFEVFRQHLTPEQKEIPFHYLMHTLFVDDNIYSFEDLVRMREEDFKICLEISWSGD